MRYTLRLLTSQQFQRAAALVCAAELIRQEDQPTWGEKPFTIGLWVGSAVSPKRFDEARRQVEAVRATTANAPTDSPCCSSNDARGAAPRSTRNAMSQPSRRSSGSRSTVAIGTENARSPKMATPTGRCRSSRSTTKSIAIRRPSCWPRSTSLPVSLGKGRRPACSATCRVVPPARLSPPGQPRGLHRAVTQRERGRRSYPRVTVQPVDRLRPPDLIIQDELHLITGALGTAVGCSKLLSICCPPTAGTGRPSVR